MSVNKADKIIPKNKYLSDNSVTVLLPVMDETYSLIETADTVILENAQELKEVIIVTSNRTTADSLAVVDDLVGRYSGLVSSFQQTTPYLGGALQDCFRKMTGDYVVVMASDLETDPKLLKTLIAAQRENPRAIITCSRWIKGGEFRGYNRVKYMLNYCFQKIFTVVLNVRLSDLTYAYRIMPSEIAKRIVWDEFRHPFLFEILLKPLKIGVRIVEIPAIWQARSEGRSSNPFHMNFMYFRIGLKVLLLPNSVKLRDEDY